MNAVYFDLESEPIPTGWDRRDRLPIITSAMLTLTVINGEPKPTAGFCWAGMGEMALANRPLDLKTTEGMIQSGEMPANKEMTPDEVEEMFDALVSLLKKPLDGQRKPLFTFNGTGFDFPAIASNIPHRRADIAKLAMGSYDPCFQFVRRFGYPIKLKAIAERMLGRTKPEGIDGSMASAIWPLDAAKVLRYNVGDVQLFRDVVEAMMEEKMVRWFNNKGNKSQQPIDTWYKVEKLCELPEPDRRRWKDYDGKFDLHNYVDWMEEKEGIDE